MLLFNTMCPQLLEITDSKRLLQVELDFAVPFIKIPVKKSVEMTKGAMANINLGALVLTGVLTFGAVVVVPALISILNTKLFLPHISLETSSYSQYRSK